METMGYAAEPLDVLMRFGIDPQLAERASTWAKPFITSSFSTGEDEPAPQPVKFSMPAMLRDLSVVIQRPVRDIIVMPDDRLNALIMQKMKSEALSPKKRISVLLAETYDGQVRGLAKGLRLQLRDSLSRIFRTRDASSYNSVEYAMGVAKTDILYYFLCLAILGDAARTKRLGDLIGHLHAAVPLAVVDVPKCIWMVHRVA